MFNPMTPPQVNSYSEPCCLRPLHSQGVPSMGTEGLSGLPFCHQANFMSGSQGYGAARETSSCTEGEHWGNPPCPCPSGTCSAGEGGEARAKLKVRNIQRQRQPGDSSKNTPSPSGPPNMAVGNMSVLLGSLPGETQFLNSSA
uniref:Gli1 protein n=1 Tax=Mus musculus TaxID=10090 RepID=A2RRI6_MOUSE|nr:Gli1 protein [Mus musculus]